MAKTQIRYMLRAFPKPFGGPLQIRHHVRMLAEAGFDAAIVVDNDSDQHFYNINVPTVFHRDFNVSDKQICVIPEGWRDHYVKLKDTNCEKICFCQNHYYVFRTFANDESFKNFGIESVMCCSQQIANHIERYYGISDVNVVPCGIEAPDTVPTSKLLAISFMPRKSALDAGNIRDIFRRKNPNMLSVRWIQIDGRPHGEAMKIMGQTEIFLSLSHREGFGLPPLEAMSQRTLVVGYHGGGGLEYATPRNGYWIEEGDLVGCADALKTAVEMIYRRSRETEDMLDHGQTTAARYSMDNMRLRLLQFWAGRVANI